MKDKKKLFVIVPVIVIVCVIVALIFNVQHNKKKKAESNLVNETYTIPERQTIFLDGQVQYSNKMDFVQNDANGTVDKIDVSDKQSVKEGQTLFNYKNEQIIEQYDNLEQQLRDLDSQSSMITNDSKNVQMSSNNTQKSSIQQQMDSIKDKRYTDILAPFDGVVSRPSNTDSNSGSNGVSSKVVLSLINPKMQVVANVSEKDVLKLRKNQKVQISTYGTNKQFTGKIASIGTEPVQGTQVGADATSTALAQSSSGVSNYPVYINIDNQNDIYSGFHVEATTVDESELPKIPKSAVFDHNGNKYVWRIKNNKLKRAPVDLDEYDSSYMQVRSGLNFGDKIIKKASAGMKEGDTFGTTATGN
ncbi:efflux RND transporter periplasmic adaptor subunit [Clostridium tyrobutyricum]|uniref:efflux RND transporter periplasmic adaptor subunit n=1 Tax=Clostridium tyrobutyricum TaxID=1519 RepID=UPI001C3C5967|nr:efflux RND transporter periplasmic adaptor subunit [Clostridium tyrobutyricum]MBV4436618.1 efflux RND transporter periplasmic adaptor subunit [Clostridium tyrobutyricum]